MKNIKLLLVIQVFTLYACSQAPRNGNANKPVATDTRVGGSCEGCEAVYECPLPFAELPAADTLPGFDSRGPQLEVSGTIYQADGKTAAKDIILYVYHTDQQGIYPKKGNETGMAQQHGYIRSWIKTDARGQYRFVTLLPASYPNSRNPKHIHAIIKEPGKTAYWIDEFLFADDPLLPAAEKNRTRAAGGSGLLTPVLENNVRKARRDIVLGLQVSGYPRP